MKYELGVHLITRTQYNTTKHHSIGMHLSGVSNRINVCIENAYDAYLTKKNSSQVLKKMLIEKFQSVCDDAKLYLCNRVEDFFS